jgi:hypothetical protein
MAASAGPLTCRAARSKSPTRATFGRYAALPFRGQGAVATDLVWVGPPDVPMFRFNRTQGCFLERVSIRSVRGTPLLEGVRIEQGALDDHNPKHARGLDSSLLTVRDVVFRGRAALGR